MKTLPKCRKSGLAAIAAATLACWLPLTPAVGQVQVWPNNAAGEGIAVYGTGELTARPNMVEIDLHVSGKAELTGDALVKYRDSKKRLLEALDKLKLPGLSTDELSLTIAAGTSIDQQQRMMNGMPQAPSKTQIDVSSLVRVRLKDVRELAPEELIKTVGKLLDAAQDSGVGVGPSQAEIMQAMRYGNYTSNSAPVRFIVSDLAELREKAYEQAVADARSRAARLAKLSQVKLGAALSVQEIAVAGDLSVRQQTAMHQNNNFQIVRPTADASDEEPRLASTSLTNIPVLVKLYVRFAIMPADPATAQK
jgi:uncharacterized protein YggE